LNKEAKTEAKDEKRPPENDEIKHPEISLVDRQGRFHRRINTREVLWRLNRAEEKLVVVKPAENGSMPLCKIFSIEELLKKEREMKCKAAEREKGEKMAKELELTWTIGLADMDLKFRQMAKFLGEGRKLDVTITRKYRRQVPDRDQDELRAIVDKVRAAALAVKGAKEYRPPDGRLAETMLLYFEGPKGGIQGRAENAGAVGLPGPERAGAAVAVS
jgi:translation initiation factor IF-3